MGKHILPIGWHNWGKESNEKTSRYGEYGSKGPGAQGERAAWAKNPDSAEVKALLDLNKVFSNTTTWNPLEK